MIGIRHQRGAHGIHFGQRCCRFGPLLHIWKIAEPEKGTAELRDFESHIGQSGRDRSGFTVLVSTGHQPIDVLLPDVAAQ